MAIKGHVSIELKDVNTGEVERIEGDNMVTNGFNKLLSMISSSKARGKSGPDITLPATSFFGGLILYKEPLVESADNYVMSTEPVLARAGQYSSQSLISGSYNSVESGRTETGYRHVWDFATSQANGIVSALSLCHPYASDNDAHEYNAWTGNYGETRMNYQLYFDEENNEYYCFTHGSNYNITIYKLRVPGLPLGVGNQFFEPLNAKGEDTIYDDSLSFEGHEPCNSSAAYDIPTNKCYVCSYSGQKYLIFDCATKTASVRTISLPVGKEKRYYQNICVWNGNVYYVANSGTYLVRVNIFDPTDYHEFTELVCTDRHSLSITNGGDGLYIAGFNGRWRINADDTYESVTNYVSKNPISKYYLGSIFGGERSSVLLRLAFRLTIHNLPSPITKTAAQTMKVIYTLTDATS